MNILLGPLALTIRYVLLIGGTALSTAGVITATGNNHFCFDAVAVANTAAAGLVMALGGSGAVVGGIGWRFWAAKKNGVR